MGKTTRSSLALFVMSAWLFIGGCSNQQSEVTPEPSVENTMNAPSAPTSIETQAKTDAKKAIEEMNFKLYALANKTIKVPGVDEQQHSVAWVEKHCGLQMLAGSGDTVQIGEDMQKRKDSKKYATIYNQHVYKACLVFQKNYTPS